MEGKVVEIYYLVDEFCKEFEQARKGHLLTENLTKRAETENLRCQIVK